MLKNVGTSVVLAHPDRLLREGIARILDQASFRVVGQVDNALELADITADLMPDVVLLDWGISEASVHLLAKLVQRTPDLVVVTLTKCGCPQNLIQSIKAGAKGHLSVDLSPDEFLRSLDVLIRGDVVISRDIVHGLGPDSAAEEPIDKLTAGLSERQIEVLKLVGQGSTNREIAQELFISEHTVKAHVRSILSKLEVRNRQQAAAYAIENGLSHREQ